MEKPLTDDQLRQAHELLTKHATDTADTALSDALHKFAVTQKWEEPTAKEIAANIHV